MFPTPDCKVGNHPEHALAWCLASPTFHPSQSQTHRGVHLHVYTLNLGDFLYAARVGAFEEDSTLLSSSTSSAIWSEDLTFSFIGRIFTLQLSFFMTPGPEDALVFEVNPSFEYSIWVHDENFFLANQNIFGLPNLLWKITRGQLRKQGLYHEITLTKQKKLNLEKKPCEEDPFYSFRN